MLGERRAQLLVANGVTHLADHLGREPTLDEQQLPEKLHDEVARVRHPGRRHQTMSPAQRSASAMIARAGFAAPWVGNTEPSTTTRLSMPQTRWLASTTESSGEKPMRHPPTRCA